MSSSRKLTKENYKEESKQKSTVGMHIDCSITVQIKFHTP